MLRHKLYGMSVTGKAWLGTAHQNGPAALVSPGSIWKMQTPRPLPDPLDHNMHFFFFFWSCSHTLDFNRWFIHAKLWEKMGVKKKRAWETVSEDTSLKLLSQITLRNKKPKPSLGLKNHVPHTENVQGNLKRTQSSNFKQLRAQGLNSWASLFHNSLQHQTYYVPSESDELYHVQPS